MRVLAVVHGTDAPPGSFGDVVRERGHSVETWAIGAAPEPAGEFGAVMLFGGAMHADEEEHHPWLRDEDVFIRRLLERRVPLLGVCLGAQLMAKAAGARVYPLPGPEVGWVDVELTGDAADDPVFAALPVRFPAFQWHYYAFDVPDGARELGRSTACPEAFRLGDTSWAVQFHPEVTSEIVARWTEESADPVPPGFLAETERRIGEWMRVGRSLCAGFLGVAERAAISA